MPESPTAKRPGDQGEARPAVAPGSPAAATSVVVPARDAADTIAEALHSVLCQRQLPGEVVLVDDGSTDGTLERAHPLVESLRGAGVHVVVAASGGGGPSRARNRALQEASGSWIAFLDADDVWHPDKLASQLSVVEGLPGAVGVASDWVRPPLAGTAVPEHIPRSVIGYEELLALNRFQTSTVVVRAAALAEAGGFDPALDVAEDWDAWLRTARLGPFVKLDWPLVAYRDRPGGVSKDLRRLHEAMGRMLARERARAEISPAAFEELLAWHHLRFAVNFALEQDVGGVAIALRGIARDASVGGVPSAVRSRLAPFLGGRLRARLPERWRGGRR